MLKTRQTSKPTNRLLAVAFTVGLFLFLPAALKAQPAPTPPPSKCTDHDQDKCIQVRRTVMAPRIVSDTFGKRIAQNFIAIQVTIGNHDQEFQYLINDVSLTMPKEIFTPQPTEGFFFSSAELSLLRGVAEKGQGQDKRNKFLRMFRAVGTIAGGLVGVVGFGPSFAEAVAVFNGPVINAYSEAFPDYTINQMNRLNDSAYAANTLIPAKHSKIVVAFIPQSMFLSKEQRAVFWDDPTALYPDSSGNCKFAQCIDFRQVGTWIDGDFITQIGNMPPIVVGDQIDASEVQKFEDEKPVVKGALIGRFLSGTSVDFFDVPAGLSITKDGEPTGGQINFIIKSSTPVPPDTKLNFVVSNAQGTQKYTKELRYMPDPPTLTKVDPPSGKQGSPVTLTLTGTNFIPGRTRVLVSGGGIDVSPPTEVLGTSLKVKLIIFDGATASPRDLTVVNDNSQSSPKTFTVTPKTPSQ